MRTIIQNQTFEDGALVWGMFSHTDFVGCTFKGTARNCNFVETHFTDCTFDPTFTFESCNLGGDVQGLPERFPLPEAPVDSILFGALYG